MFKRAVLSGSPFGVAQLFIKSAVALYILCLAPIAVFAHGSKDSVSQEPLTVEDAMHALRLPGLAPIALSPDGELVAYTLADRTKRQSIVDRRYRNFTPTGVYTEAVGCDMWITNTKGRQCENLTGAKGTNWAPVWSPDGKYLAFYSDRSGTANLWVWQRATNQFRQLSNAIVRPFFNFQVVRWSPDSRQILVKVLPEGMNVEQAADLAAGPADEKKGAREKNGSDATVVVYSNMPQPPATNAAPKPATRTLLDDKWMNRYSADLALIDVASGKIDHIAKGIRALGYWFSPDGKYIAYTHCKGMEDNSQRMIYQIVLLNLADRSSLILVPDLHQDYGINVSWSPDSKSIAYLRQDAEEKGDCYVVPIAGGPARNITQGKHPSFRTDYRAPLWDSKSNFIYLISPPTNGQNGTDNIWKASVRDAPLSVAGRIPNRVILEIVAPQDGGPFWSPDQGRSLVVETRDEETMQVGFYKLDLETAKASKIFEERAYFGNLIFDADCSQDGQTLVYVAQDSQHPEDIWVTGADFSNRHCVSNINSSVSTLTFGASRLINWLSLDGKPLRGALLLPANYDPAKRYPLIVNVYGGALYSKRIYCFGLLGEAVDNMQLLATRGYAVLVPDCPLAKGTPMLDLLKTVSPGVDKVIELGIADPDRIGVMGHSFGGYSTLGLIVQTNRFRAAVESAGTSDLISAYGQMDDSGASTTIGWCESGQVGMVGTPWQFRDRYIQNSPIFYLDRVTTPLLIVNGELDDATPPKQSEEVFVGLRRLGKEVVYAKYLGEGHWPGAWSYANCTDYLTRVIQWFDQHLKAPSR